MALPFPACFQGIKSCRPFPQGVLRVVASEGMQRVMDFVDLTARDLSTLEQDGFQLAMISKRDSFLVSYGFTLVTTSIIILTQSLHPIASVFLVLE